MQSYTGDTNELDSLQNDFDKEIQRHNQILENERLESSIEQRKTYAEKSFRFMAGYTIIATIILIVNGLEILKIEMAPLAAFMGTISASMILFGWVLKGLFDGK